MLRTASASDNSMLRILFSMAFGLIGWALLPTANRFLDFGEKRKRFRSIPWRPPIKERLQMRQKCLMSSAIEIPTLRSERDEQASTVVWVRRSCHKSLLLQLVDDPSDRAQPDV